MRLLTPEQVADLFHIKVKHLIELARQKKIPAIKIGRLWRFPEDSLRDWIGKEMSSNDHQDIDSIVKQIVSEVS